MLLLMLWLDRWSGNDIRNAIRVVGKIVTHDHVKYIIHIHNHNYLCMFGLVLHHTIARVLETEEEDQRRAQAKDWNQIACRMNVTLVYYHDYGTVDGRVRNRIVFY